ncbi:MAG: hypothetical protein NTW96_04260 [Planctomycetia bacterium]|nr:hypothetical protein [Planctomycetia bacterium]
MDLHDSWTARFGLVLLVLLGSGCSRSGLDRLAVRGTVRVDNQPLEGGSITFLPTDGRGPTAGAMIASGDYRIDRDQGVVAGEYRVKITYFRKTGKQVYNGLEQRMVDEMAETLPPPYNTKTRLRRTITGDNSRQLDFDLSADGSTD